MGPIPAVHARTALRPVRRNWSQAPEQTFPRADTAAGASGEPDIGPRAVTRLRGGGEGQGDQQDVSSDHQGAERQLRVQHQAEVEHGPERPAAPAGDQACRAVR